MHLKQSSFLNNFSLAESTFNILSFFHAEIEVEIAVVIIIKMLAIKRAIWVIDILRTDQAFNFINQTLTCMQMLMNLFKFIVCSLIVTCWRSELILCWRSFSKVSLLYFSFALSFWNFIQNSWKKILFWYSFKNYHWTVWCQLKSSYILFMIDSISSASKNEFMIMFLILSAICLIIVSLTQLFTYAIFISSIEKWFLFIFSLFCIQNNQLFTFCLESLNKDESNNLIDFENQSFKIKVLSRLDVAFKWCIIMFFFFISFCKYVWTTFNVVCVTFNLMLIAFNSTLILLMSFNIWIMSLWILISMSCYWHMYLIKTMRSSASWVFIQAFSSVLMLILIISWSKSNAFMFSSSIFNDAFRSSSSDAVWFCDKSDFLSASWVS